MPLNLFSDPVLRARQEALNAQWYALNQTIDNCALTGASQSFFSQFYADKAAWDEFFESGSDWSSDSANATNRYQDKLREYTKGVGVYCSQASPEAGGGPYVPGVSPAPADSKSLWDRAIDTPKDVLNAAESFVAKIGIIAAIVIGAILFAIVYVSVKGKVSAGPVAIGG